ncbi:MAG: ABC transporter substrate-binding protein, partial [Armatimonadetes bacterium]|nr:ABC transporter substrate-binding protein [Armatimonadota bacterium]
MGLSVVFAQIRRRRFLRTVCGFTAVMVIAALIGYGPPAPGAGAPVVKLGHISPLSGPLATGAVYLRNGVELAVKDINAAGGVKALRGARLEVVFGDSKGDPKVGASEAERLITVEKVSGLMGAYQSTVCKTVSEVAERYEVPFIINTGVLEDLTTPQKNYTFRHSARSSEFASSHIAFLAEVGRQTGKPARTLALVHDDTDFGQSTGRAWRAALEKSRGQFTVVLEESLPINLTDISATLSKLKALKPDAILVAAYPTVDFLLTNGLAANRINAMGVLFSSGGPSNPVYFD